MEMQIVVTELVSSFSFARPKDVVIRKANMGTLTHPVVRAEEEKGSQMPLVITPV